MCPRDRAGLDIELDELGGLGPAESVLDAALEPVKVLAVGGHDEAIDHVVDRDDDEGQLPGGEGVALRKNRLHGVNVEVSRGAVEAPKLRGQVQIFCGGIAFRRMNA